MSFVALHRRLPVGLVLRVVNKAPEAPEPPTCACKVMPRRLTVPVTSYRLFEFGSPRGATQGRNAGPMAL